MTTSLYCSQIEDLMFEIPTLVIWIKIMPIPFPNVRDNWCQLLKSNNKSGNATTMSQWHHCFCFFSFILAFCAELWRVERSTIGEPNFRYIVCYNFQYGEGRTLLESMSLLTSAFVKLQHDLDDWQLVIVANVKGVVIAIMEATWYLYFLKLYQDLWIQR
jgi:hypothetical protein